MKIVRRWPQFNAASANEIAELFEVIDPPLRKFVKRQRVRFGGRTGG